ncbi:helix-turn-helix domain-containing protein [Pseudorhodoplanes sp.]|uniref:helix-turn-helix domain-containing protein n=1 Tax=Pseudorhodoplanes sp. TaxID=1934341 RepID=UPI003D14208F
MDVRQRIGLNLAELRKRLCLSQEELAHRSGIHQTYLSGVERGRRNPTAVLLQRLATALDTAIDVLVRRRGESPSPKESATSSAAPLAG